MELAMVAAMAATVLAMVCAPAAAGEKVEVPVTLEINGLGQVTRAYGMAGTARNSVDSQQLIACFVSATTAGAQGGCEARNAAGTSTLCITSSASLLAAVGEENLPRHVYFGDGSPIADDMLDTVREVYRETAISFPWQPGDVLMLDNRLVAHGRNPFTGDRKVIVAMA